MDKSDPLLLMSRDEQIGRFVDDRFCADQEDLLPLYLQETGNFEEWLRLRAIDEHRTNSRLLKKALRLRNKDDISTVLQFNAATITDTYWVKKAGGEETYADIRFTSNYFDKLALRGDADSFNQPPSRTPELTNIGSFEKCWRLIEGEWWMYKAGNDAERFTEVFSSELAELTGISAVPYESIGSYVRSRDFTRGAEVNFESAYGLIGDLIEYEEIWDVLEKTDPGLAHSFTEMTFFDALLFNMDRHEHNWGILRDPSTGEILRMAPLYDHNIALITRGYPQDIERRQDRLIADFVQLIRARPTGFVIPEITEASAREAVLRVNIPLARPAGLGLEPTDYITRFICNGYLRILDAI